MKKGKFLKSFYSKRLVAASATAMGLLLESPLTMAAAIDMADVKMFLDDQQAAIKLVAGSLVFLVVIGAVFKIIASLISGTAR